jgi:hypothetical protein
MIAKGNGLSLAALALTGCFARDDVREPHKGMISRKGTMLQSARGRRLPLWKRIANRGEVKYD